MDKTEILNKVFFKQRRNIIKKYFNGIEYATKDFNQKVYNVWYVNFKTDIGIILGIISVILGIVSILITLL